MRFQQEELNNIYQRIVLQTHQLDAYDFIVGCIHCH